MKILIVIFLTFFSLHLTLFAQTQSTQRTYDGKEFEALKNRLAKGWNTWDTRSVLSHVLLPESLAIDLQLIDHELGDTLKETLIGREDFGSKEHVIPGPHAYDGSYTELIVEWHKIHVKIQSASQNGQLFLLISPIQFSPLDSIIVRPKMLWGRQGTIAVDNGKISVKTGSKKIELAMVGGQYTSKKDYLTVSMNKIAAISSEVSTSTQDIKKIISDAREKFMAGRSKYKEDSELYNAMQTSLSWNVIYEPTKNRVITPVSRLWNIGWNGWVLFEWDTYFAAYMLSLDNKDLAYANAIAMTKEITKSGFVPNYGSSNYASDDRSEPPVGALIVKEIYKKYKEKWLLNELFDDLLKWNRWWSDKRDIDGYLCWGSDPYIPGKIPAFLIKGIGTKKGAQWESGLDNSPMWDDAVYDSTKHCLMLADVGLMSLYITDCRSLAEIADVLGKMQIAKELTQRADKYARKLETLWDDQFGLYLNKNLVTGKLSRRLSPTLFYPLLAKVPNQQKASRMMKEHFYNPDEFWGEFIMPSISRNDPAFKDNKYWRGRIWAPMNFLVYLGTRNYQLPMAKKDMIEKSKNLLLKSWIGTYHIFENYNSVNGRGDDSGMSDAFYHWGSLLGFMDIINNGFMPSPQLSIK
ncbi:MAG: trehalase family glycosidase [Bacteroidetes bacterium]|nr:trehalase family glycosidase [Bacteroidota bacterium]